MARNVIAFVLMVAATATVGILAFDLYRASEDQARSQFEENQLLMTRHVAIELEAYLRSRSQGVRALASFASVRHKAPDQMARDVLAYLERLGQLHVRAISVFDENGTVRYSTAATGGPSAAAGELLDWARKPENHEQLFLSCQDPRAGLCLLATPVYRDGRAGLPEAASAFAGVVALTVDLAAFLSEEIASEAPAMAMNLREIWLMDASGTLLFHSHHPEMVSRNIRQGTPRCTECHTSFDHVERMLTVRQGTAAYQLSGRPKKLAAFSPMDFGSASWTVVVNAPYDRVSAFAARHLRGTLVLLGVVVAAFAGAATLIQRSYRSRVRAEEVARQWQQKQALEEEIRHSKTYLESILANSLDLILTIRKDGTLGFVNRQLERITGYEREKVIGRHFLDFVPEHEKPSALEMWRGANAGASGSYEMQVRKADGSLMEGLLSYSVVEGFDEFLVLLKDIGERKRMEQALRESEERFRNLVQGVDAIVWEADAESFAFTFVSEQAEAILGYPVRQWLEEVGFWANHIHPEDRERAVASCRQATATGQDHEFEYRALAADGHSVCLRDIVRIVRDAEGHFIKLRGLMIDVTESRAAEERLRESEERYRTIIEHSNDMIWTVDTEGRFQFFNRRSEEISGYRLEEWLGRSFAPLILEEDLPGVLDVFRRTIGGASQQYEVRVRRQDGSVFALSVNTAPIYSKGEVVGTVSFGRDITEKKRAEAELRQRLAELESIHRLSVAVSRADALEEVYDRALEALERSAHADRASVLLFDPDGVLRFKAWRGLSESYRRTVEGHSPWSPAETDPKPILVGDVESEPTLHKFRSVIVAEGVRSLGFIPLVYQGRLLGKFMVCYNAPRRFSADELRLLVTFASHVATAIERKRAEDELRRSEEKYRALFEESKEIIFISTPEGRLLDINPAGAELFGYDSPEEMLATAVLADLYCDPSTRAAYQEEIGRIGFVKDCALELKTRDGRRLTVLETSTAVRDERGEAVAYRGILRDVTDRKRLEEQLLHSQKMEGLGQLASGVAHDFNNVLSGILGYAELALRKLDANHPLHRNLSHIRELGERAAGITRQLLAFSRRQVLEPQDLDLNRLISDLLRLLGKTLGEHIEIEFRPNSSLKVVHADPAQMEQILVNLCVNARDAMPKGGRLVIETGNAELDEPAARMRDGVRPGCYAVLTVTDTGEGMDESVREHIFEPFYTTKEPGKGTGLGLATVHGLVGQHGGFIDVQSTVGQGTTFRIYLPSVDRPAEVPEAAASKPIRGGTETILLVEDDPAVRAVTEAALREFGYHVVAAANGEEALRQLEGNSSVALVVSDVVMPKMGGTELRDRARRLNTRPRWLFVSGYPRGAAHEKLTADAAEFLAKPVTTAALLAKIREILDRPGSHS